MLGTPTSGFGQTVAAETRTYRDAESHNEVRVNLCFDDRADARTV